MTLHKMIDGICVEMTQEEEASLKSHWDFCEMKKLNEKAYKDRQEFLMTKYPNIYETLDVICTQLGI